MFTFVMLLFILSIIVCSLYAFVDCVILDGMLSEYIQEYVEKRLHKDD